MQFLLKCQGQINRIAGGGFEEGELQNLPFNRRIFCKWKDEVREAHKGS